MIDALDRDGKDPNVALWAKLPDYEDWRLVIASDRIRPICLALMAIPRSMRRWRRLGIPMRKRPKISLTSNGSIRLFKLCDVSLRRRDRHLWDAAWAAKYSATSTWKMLSSIVSVEHRNQIRVTPAMGLT